VKPLNIQERKSSILKFYSYLLITIIIIGSIVYINIKFPVTQSVNNEAIRKAYNAQRKINVLFLIDASQMMSEYLPEIGKSMVETSEIILSNDTINEIRFAAAIYRDAVEGAWVFQHNNLRNSTAISVANWLSDIITVDSYDKDEPEAVYYGLLKGLMLDFLIVNETNVLILLGGAGNHAQESLTEVDPAKISSLLSKHMCNIAAFQVYNLDRPTYDQFLIQIRDKILYPTAFQNLEIANEIFFYIEKPGWLIEKTESGTSYYIDDGRVSFNEIHVVQKNHKIEPDSLKENIKNFLDKILNENIHKLNALEKLSRGENIELSEAETSGLFKVLKESGLNNQELERIYSQSSLDTN
jgi:hypothetical protein